MEIPVSGGVVWGDDTSTPGPPLVLLHAAVGDSRGWEPILPDLTEHHRVIRYDARGYGRSPAPTTEYTLGTDLTAVLDHLTLDRVVLVGSSMGGSTAICEALANPDRVAGLVLLCSGLTGFPWPDEPELDAQYDELIASADHAGLLAFGLNLWAAAGHDGAVIEQLSSAIPGWLAQTEYLRPDPPAYDRLHELRIPTAVLAGDRDRPILAACAGALAARIPDARFIWATGVDHFPAIRDPALISETIKSIAAEAAS